MKNFFVSDDIYQNFSNEHWFALLFLALTCYSLIKVSTHSQSETIKKRILLILAYIIFIAPFIRMGFDASLRPLTIQDDLPLHLCRILAVIAPFMVHFYNEKAIKIFYYLILAGTLHGLITADIEFNFPHYAYFFYWIYHGGLVVMAIYGILVFKTHLSLSDGLRAFLWINIYFGIMHILNVSIESNYMYSRSKPEVDTLMDLLGEWPVYILGLEILAFLMILLIHLVMGRWLVPKKMRS